MQLDVIRCKPLPGDIPRKHFLSVRKVIHSQSHLCRPLPLRTGFCHSNPLQCPVHRNAAVQSAGLILPFQRQRFACSAFEIQHGKIIPAVPVTAHQRLTAAQLHTHQPRIVLTGLCTVQITVFSRLHIIETVAFVPFPARNGVQKAAYVHLLHKMIAAGGGHIIGVNRPALQDHLTVQQQRSVLPRYRVTVNGPAVFVFGLWGDLNDIPDFGDGHKHPVLFAFQRDTAVVQRSFQPVFAFQISFGNDQVVLGVQHLQQTVLVKHCDDMALHRIDLCLFIGPQDCRQIVKGHALGQPLQRLHRLHLLLFRWRGRRLLRLLLLLRCGCFGEFLRFFAGCRQHQCKQHQPNQKFLHKPSSFHEKRMFSLKLHPINPFGIGFPLAYIHQQCPFSHQPDFRLTGHQLHGHIPLI